MKNEITTNNIVVCKATESGGCMWTPILPPKLDPESRPKSGNVASDGEQARHSEIALQTEVYES